MGWYLNPALTRFRAAVNAKWPNRDKRSDGTIGDYAHQQTTSDHNPDTDGSVDAWDMDVDGVDIALLIKVFEAHESAQYWIWNRVIASRTNGWRRTAYTGSNPHTSHVHWNTRGTHENSAQPWLIEWGAPAWPGRVLQLGVQGQDVRMWQQQMKYRGWTIGVDGDFGPESDRVCRAFQAEKKLTVDGLVGPVTWRASWTMPTT